MKEIRFEDYWRITRWMDIKDDWEFSVACLCVFRLTTEISKFAIEKYDMGRQSFERIMEYGLFQFSKPVDIKKEKWLYRNEKHIQLARQWASEYAFNSIVGAYMELIDLVLNLI